MGKLVVYREATMMHRRDVVTVFLDGKPVGEVRDGNRLVIDVPCGARSISVKCNLSARRTCKVDIQDGKTTTLLAYFSFWRGLRLQPS